MPTGSNYKAQFFMHRQDRVRIAAPRIIQKVLEIVNPSSVVDVGCGTGEFAAAFSEQGIKDILGIDGVYVKRELLAISQEQFLPIDLNQPFELGRTYDLAVCLEVAEHLNPGSASGFVASLTRLAPVVLFSAAIPYQGGTHHVNEQWPEYWASLFQQHRYVAVDAIRYSIWHDREIPTHYRQNILFFCKQEVLDTNEKLAQAYQATHLDALSLVHPDMYLDRNTFTLRMIRRILMPVLGPLGRLNERRWRSTSHVILNIK